MDKISLLQSNKQKILQAGKTVREDLKKLVDPDSFVELSAFSFSKNDEFNAESAGDGVITGFATISEYPFYVVAQNPQALSGGISTATCEKISRCLDKALNSSTPVIYLLSSLGVRIGEGVEVLEGLASLILKASELQGAVAQYLIVNGEVYGQISLLAGICDFTFFIDGKSVLAPNSPLVIAASSNANLPAEKVGGADGLKDSGLVTFKVKNIEEARDRIVKLSDLISQPVIDCDDLNSVLPALDKACSAEDILKVFDKDSAVELFPADSPEIRCMIARIGGIAVAAVIFGGENGVELTAQNVDKLSSFAVIASYFSLPYITFVNTLGVKPDLKTNSSAVIRRLGEYIAVFEEMQASKISVVYSKAIGLGYTAFAAKSLGFDFVYAFATSKIALFDSVQGAEIEFAEDKNADKELLKAKYSEEKSDPMNAAKGGYTDGIIQPSLVRQYLIASLQTGLR